MKMLVTGGAGFIGSHIAKELIGEGHEVVVLDDLSGGFRENIPQKAIFEKASVVDTKKINSIFKKYKFGYVYHLAAYAAEGLSHFIRAFNYENNVIGSMNIINASVNNNVKCIVFTSSIAVYGALKPPFSEEMQPAPEDPYGIAKYAVEMDLMAARKMWGLDYIIFRPHNVYGENQNIGDPYRNVIGIFMNQVIQKKPLTIFGDGSQTRAFTYIKDISEIIAKSVFQEKAYNQVFNIGADKDYSVNRLAKTVLKCMNADNEIIYLEPRQEAVNAYSLHDRVRKVFGYEQHVGLEEGVSKMAEWAKGIGSREAKKFDNIEVLKNIPEIWIR